MVQPEPDVAAIDVPDAPDRPSLAGRLSLGIGVRTGSARIDRIDC